MNESLNFSRLTLGDRNRYCQFYHVCPEKASDYTFVNLFAWDHARKYEVSFSSGLCWLKINDPEEKLWSPLGEWYKVDWEKTLHETFPEGTQFFRAPEGLALHLQEKLGEKVSLEEERSEWEYVYSVEDLIELRGNKYHKKKNLLKQFMKNYNWQYHEVDIADVKMLLDVQKEWCRWKNCDGSPGLKAEHDAIRTVLENWENLPGLMAGILSVEDRLVAYTVAEAMDDETLVIHFEKGLGEFKGVYQAINQIFLEKSASSFTWVNREQDMGNEGLRKAKMSYQPHHFLKKYVVTWKP
jgi:hypothetical protein